MLLTLFVFWTVTAVTTVAVWTPNEDIALISAWIPAPPTESDPAMVNAVFMDDYRIRILKAEEVFSQADMGAGFVLLRKNK
jgi:hypothetical protein